MILLSELHLAKQEMNRAEGRLSHQALVLGSSTHPMTRVLREALTHLHMARHALQHAIDREEADREAHR